MPYRQKLALNKKVLDSNDRITLGFFESNTDLIIGQRGDTKSNTEGMAKIELQSLINNTINSHLNPRVKDRLDAIKKSKAKSERTYKSKVQGLSPKIQEVIHYANIRRLKEKYKK